MGPGTSLQPRPWQGVMGLTLPTVLSPYPPHCPLLRSQGCQRAHPISSRVPPTSLTPMRSVGQVPRTCCLKKCFLQQLFSARCRSQGTVAARQGWVNNSVFTASVVEQTLFVFPTRLLLSKASHIPQTSKDAAWALGA